jgi:hypothetical protein
MAKDTPKRTTKPRAPKPPVIPMRSDQTADHEIGLIQQRLIGRVVVEWSKLENCINDLIWRLTDLTFEDGRLLTERMDVSRSIIILRALAGRKLEGELQQELINALAAADELRDDRNFIIHAAWGTLRPENVAVAASLRAKSEPGIVVSEDFPHRRMRAIATEIVRVKRTLVKIMNALPAPSYDKSHE